VGTLFKNTANRTSKTETLIFITPRILSEALLD
jgi:type II secretory pathway component HofQ